LVHVVDAAAENPVNDYQTVKEVCVSFCNNTNHIFSLIALLAPLACLEILGYKHCCHG